MSRKSKESASFITKVFQDFLIHIHISSNRKKSLPAEGRMKVKVFICGDGCRLGLGFIDCSVFFLCWVSSACVFGFSKSNGVKVQQ